jgi:hypothetical protein
LVTLPNEIIVPYLVFLFVPLISRMSDCSLPIRQCACAGFSICMTLIVIEETIPSPVEMEQTLQKQVKQNYIQNIEQIESGKFTFFLFYIYLFSGLYNVNFYLNY